MAEQENIRLVRQLFDDINRHDLSKNDQYFADNVRTEAAGSMSSLDRNRGKQYTQNFLNAFPDLKFDIKDIIAQGDKVAVTWVAHGTHKAPLTSIDGTMTVPASNQSVTTPGVTVVELRNNHIVRQEIYWDEVPLLTQLGVLRMDQMQGNRGRNP